MQMPTNNDLYESRDASTAAGYYSVMHATSLEEFESNENEEE